METSALISCLLLTVTSVEAQKAQVASERPLPQWLTGIIAVCGFLFLVFVTFLVNRAWCGGSSSDKSKEGDGFVMTIGHTDDMLDHVRSKENKNAYHNVMLDNNDDKVTSM